MVKRKRNTPKDRQTDTPSSIMWASQRVTESEGMAPQGDSQLPVFCYCHPGILMGFEVTIFTGLPKHKRVGYLYC